MKLTPILMATLILGSEQAPRGVEMASWALGGGFGEGGAEATESSDSSGGHTAFQWGGTLSAIFLLILRYTRRRSSMPSTLLVLYLFTSFPTVLFKILSGQFGCWLAFLAVAANLFFPMTFPVSRFLLFVITPDALADVLRDSIVGGVVCLTIGILVLVFEIREMGGCGNWEFSPYCCVYHLGIVFLLFFPVLYLCLGTW
ncbi:cold-regulated 413 plasma membrane protein 4-like [Diospyros lotus]|uniref:cold-regulated 413 plasma membrane protein 4-like n=1 Tax=Diospyros lotus TaxID=55363 RepID=UPI002256C7F9|nr:cold-regulated 413 plasma membrane protein 4-like [Diospyros lotus]